jgi:glycosyltransferase involved in cell wall biosynthesis
MSHIPERSVARPRISIVVPALNEARNLEVVLPELPPVYEVILVDGTSTDGTVETALRVLPTVKIVKQTRRGKGNALVCGFEAASGDVVVMFDADGSADPAEIPPLRRGTSRRCGLRQGKPGAGGRRQPGHHGAAVLGEPRYDLHHQSSVPHRLYRSPLRLQRLLA